MAKVERIVMLVNRYTLFICLFCLPLFSRSQVNLVSQNSKGKKSWSFLVAPGLSKSKLPSGTGVGYASDYYVNLRIREPYLFAYRIEVSQERTYKKGWTISKGLGFSSYSYKLYYDYDREASIGTSLTDRMDFNYAYATLKIGKPILINKFSVEPYLGVGANFLVKARYTYTNKYGGSWSNFTNKYKPWALGLEAGVKLTYQYSDDISLELRPMFSKIQKKYYDRQGPEGERFNYSYNVGLAIIKKIKNKIQD